MHSDQGHISIAKYGRWLTSEIESSGKSAGYEELRSTFSAARWAHNTVVVGGQWGKSEIDFPKVNYQSTQPTNLKIADVSIFDFTVGPRATQRRRVLVTDNFITVVDDLISSERTTFDWFFYGVNNAQWFFEKSFDKSIAQFITYIPQHSTPDQKLIWREAYVTDKPWQGVFVVDENENIGLKVWHLDVAGGKACAGSLVPPKHGDTGLYDADKMYLICQRKEGVEAHFVVVLDPFKGESNIESVTLEKNSPDKRMIKIVFKNNAVQLLSIGEGKYSLQ